MFFLKYLGNTAHQPLGGISTDRTHTYRTQESYLQELTATPPSESRKPPTKRKEHSILAEPVLAAKLAVSPPSYRDVTHP